MKFFVTVLVIIPIVALGSIFAFKKWHERNEEVRRRNAAYEASQAESRREMAYEDLVRLGIITDGVNISDVLRVIGKPDIRRTNDQLNPSERQLGAHEIWYYKSKKRALYVNTSGIVIRQYEYKQE